MTEPAQRNSIALKNACVQIWKNASCGWLRPMVTIIRPSWLEVENAMIFLRSFWLRAQAAAKRVVTAPTQRQMLRARGLVPSRGPKRISRKIPATTMVLECSREETGVGPSMAAGSQGCMKNCADFPMAPIMMAIRRHVGAMPLVKSMISSICQVPTERADQPRANNRAMSAVRL